MIIICINCNKKFEVDKALIPEKGRNIQCGSCNHVWFFKENSKEKKNDKPSKLEIKKNNIEKEIIINENLIPQKKNRKNLPAIKKETKSSNFLFRIFSFLVILTLTLIAIIVILDTFENNLIKIFPNLELFLYNLFESIKDIKLFLNDLVK
jgi:predicted Zn finger-like uncharacterized protein